MPRTENEYLILNSSQKKQVGQALHRFRTHYDLSLPAAADVLDVSRNALDEIERGRLKISPSAAYNMVHTLRGTELVEEAEELIAKIPPLASEDTYRTLLLNAYLDSRGGIYRHGLQKEMAVLTHLDRQTIGRRIREERFYDQMLKEILS